MGLAWAPKPGWVEEHVALRRWAMGSIEAPKHRCVRRWVEQRAALRGWATGAPGVPKPSWVQRRVEERAPVRN